MSSKKLNYIQLLRAIAAIAVVIFHASVATTKYSDFPSRFIDFFKFGTYGVDLFFVISGFVIYYANDDTPPGMFIRRRLERIVPIYWILTLLAVPFAYRSASAQFTWLKLAESLGFVSFLGESSPVLYVGWTLEFEMFFYISAAASMLLMRHRWRAVCMAISCLVGMGALMQTSGPIANFLTAQIMLEFLAGIVIGQIVKNRRVEWIEVAFIGVASALVVILKQDFRLLWLGVPSAFLVWCAASAGDRGLPKWIVTLGDASYSIYLIQVFTVSACGQLVHLVYPHLDPEVLIALATLLTVCAGVASYKLIESPIQRWFRNLRRQGSSRRAQQLE
ncbi:acyltransferase family protein [Herbaspirillum rhizosphaerae]|uniref:acyltransferase family protein n=1 Tax=Herbaspirillum rhizosphaerae TaxID=346179 RepID=UPI00067B0BAE|nr:acyltransferase [Herbaspirillum rhizosphaerae]